MYLSLGIKLTQRIVLDLITYFVKGTVKQINRRVFRERIDPVVTELDCSGFVSVSNGYQKVRFCEVLQII